MRCCRVKKIRVERYDNNMHKSSSLRRVHSRSPTKYTMPFVKTTDAAMVVQHIGYALRP